MAPSLIAIPEEVDVFSIPHLRMKELVDEYYRLISNTNFSELDDMEMLLDSLFRTFREFKSHEQIENKLIMRRLRTKMRSLAISNSAVCNCHEGSRLSEMLLLVIDGFSKTSTIQDRVNYGRKLIKELEAFTETFLPHMKEEEEVFQPLLLQYFTYEELCQLKEKVIKLHTMRKEAQEKGLEKSSWADCAVDLFTTTTTNSESEEEEVKVAEKKSEIELKDLPQELMLKIFSYLSPRDLCRAALVNHEWKDLSTERSLWKCLLPIQWARGYWSFEEEFWDNEKEDGFSRTSQVFDDDADVDESEDISGYCRKKLFENQIIEGILEYLLPKVGIGVKKLALGFSYAVTDSLVRKLLSACPQLEHLDLSQANITDEAFVCCSDFLVGSKMKTLILSGCINITDSTLVRLGISLNDNSCERPVHTHVRSSLGKDKNSKDLCGKYFKVCQNQIPPCKKELPCWNGNRQRCNKEILSQERDKTCKNVNKNRESTVASSASACQLSTGNICVKASPKLCCFRDNGEAYIPNVTINRRSCRQNSCQSEMYAACMKTMTGCRAVSNRTDFDRCLEHLNLSGCSNITDVGLSSLFRSGRFPRVRFLDLSGLMKLTSIGLWNAVRSSPSLQPANLFYCDNILDGPFSQEASGCRNLECANRMCCRSGD